MGKNWSKGLTKFTDPRVARNAAAHLGLRYTSHLPPELDRRRQHAAPLDLTWSPALAYAVGLIASDGNLSPNRKTTNVVSKDVDLLETFKACIPRAGKIGSHGDNWQVRVSSVEFYRWLESIGLTPAKSLTLGAIEIDDAYLIDLARGLMDGDGSIKNFVHHPGGNVRRYPDYRYERFNVSFHSASRRHLEWLRMSIHRILRIEGAILQSNRRGRLHPMYELKCGKHASLALLERMYADPSSPRLDRKWRIWRSYLARPPINSLQKRRSDETVDIGDSKSPGPQGP